MNETQKSQLERDAADALIEVLEEAGLDITGVDSGCEAELYSMLQALADLIGAAAK